MDELACFAPGMLALDSLGYGPGDREKMLTLAEEVSCIAHYSLVFIKLYVHTIALFL
ncbi:hypothetical protein Scep_025838 [Stephania cephalantha]|uniref:Uncharacterized protein n=1 Tax=Stephania cephalantha TaxID=152367 RepID=A0AAP0EJF5_9MAGN